MLQILGKTNLNFIGKRYYAFAFSGILMLIGIIAFVSLLFGKAKLGIDFSGGTLIEGYFANQVEISRLRTVMSGNGYADAVIQELQREISNSFVIRVKATAETGSKVANEIMAVIQKGFPDNPFHLGRGG